VIPSDLLSRWRSEAEVLRANAAEAQATVKERDADDLEAWLQAWWNEALPLDEAVEESGYHRDSLLRFLRERKVTNVGTIDVPRIRRAELPMKPGHSRSLPWSSDATEAVPLAPRRTTRASSTTDIMRQIAKG